MPLEFMGNDVKAVSQFLPVYWYEKANDILADFGHLTASAKGQFLQAIMIQLVFAAAFVCLVLVLKNIKEWIHSRMRTVTVVERLREVEN